MIDYTVSFLSYFSSKEVVGERPSAASDWVTIWLNKAILIKSAT
jgi:hypothetical protein